MRTKIRLQKRFVLVGILALAAPFAALLSGGAHADIDPSPGTPETFSADALPTWQIDGVVWKQAIVGDVVYAVGSFAKARPPGTAPGDPQEVDRANILAYDITTGELLPFNPTLNGQARSIAASPDGSRVYVGGEFTTVNGVTRNRLVAFNTATGAVDTAFNASVSNVVRAITVSATTVYIGGNFFNVNGSSRNRLAALSRANGALQPWVPGVDDEVYALLMSPDSSRVIVGGKFQTVNDAPRVGIGALDPVTAESMPWSSNPIPARQAGNRYSMTYDLATDGTLVYAAADGEGWHWFDGRFAVEPNTGDLVWLDNCYGATYSVFPIGQVLYSVSHAHDCASLGAFPETSPQTWYRALATTTYPTGTDQGTPSVGSAYSGQPVPTLLHWFPQVNAGSYTGMSQGGWSLTGNDQYLSMGGEFTMVNGSPQQGLTRFAIKNNAPQKVGPVPNAALTPSGVSLQPGTARISWRSTFDRDNEKLTYEVLRDGSPTPIGTAPAKTVPWNRPMLGFVDTGLEPGSTHTYRIRVKDSSGNSVGSGTSAPVTISSAGSQSDYAAAVLGDGAKHFWRLGETEGSTAYDHAGFLDATRNAGVTAAASGAIQDDPDVAATFSGTTTGFTATQSTEPAPEAFSIEAWVRTASTSGGKIVGYGNAATGVSGSYDRHLYMDNTGRIWFGVYPGAVRTVNSTQSYNNGQWHHVVATLDPTVGMALYVDGRKVGQNTTGTSSQPYTGYWRIGGDNLNGWPSAPSSRFLNGTIDEAAVYLRALPEDRIVTHWQKGSGTGPANQAPTAAFTASCTDLECSFDASGSSDPDGEIGGYAWDFGDGTTGTGATATHTYPAAGDYPVKLTVTDDGGATGTANEVVVPRPSANPSATLAADAFDRTVTGGLGTADTGGAWSLSAAAANYAVDGAVARLMLGAAGANRRAYLNAVSTTGADTTFTVSSEKVATGNGIYLWGIGRSVTGAGDYRARIRLLASGAVGMALSRTDSANAETLLTSEQTISGLTYTEGLPLKVRLRVTGTSPTELSLKVWPASGEEPADWQLTATDGTAGLQAAGGVGFGGFLSGTATNAPVLVSMDDFATTGTAVAPTAAFTAECTGLTCSVDASGATAGTSPIDSYTWSFGDGVIGTGATAQHTFAQAGTYRITLTVTDAEGLTHVATETVDVS